jgi:hypothetical protein
MEAGGILVGDGVFLHMQNLKRGDVGYPWQCPWMMDLGFRERGRWQIRWLTSKENARFTLVRPLSVRKRPTPACLILIIDGDYNVSAMNFAYGRLCVSSRASLSAPPSLYIRGLVLGTVTESVKWYGKSLRFPILGLVLVPYAKNLGP